MAVKTPDFTKAAFYHTGQFPPQTLDYAAILPALNDAAASLARYDAKMAGMVNSRLLLGPLQRQETVSTSRMEGTISTIEDLYRLEAADDSAAALADPEARDDDIETYLYALTLERTRAALEAGEPFSEHLIRSAHQSLLSFGRGASKNPGGYKREQNYVADDRSRIIYYVPISRDHLEPAMQALVSFINNDATLPLLRTAIAHVEFEALHPFEDGNGRIGRMLITLMLWRLGVLSQPHFFVSGYFEDHKSEYVNRMRAVSESGDWTGWIVFFLTALHEQARVNIETADRIFNLYAAMRERFRVVLNSHYHDQALDYIFGNPVFRNDRFVELAGIPASSARALVRRLVEDGLLRTLRPGAGRRAALYAFDPLLGLLKT